MRTITVLSLLFPLATAALAQVQGQGRFFAANGNDSNLHANRAVPDAAKGLVICFSARFHYQL